METKNDLLYFSESFTNFIRETAEQSRVSAFLNIYNRTGSWTNKGKILHRHITGNAINYLTFRKDGMLSYLPKGKELKLNERGEWSRDDRQEGKPARIIQQVMSSTMLRVITPRDLEIFSNLYKGRATDLHTIQEAIGEEIHTIYQLDGNGFNSCMQGASKGVLALYCNNPQAVKLLYIRTGDKIQARVLCWTDESGSVILDRVYGSEEYAQMFRDYARKIGAFKKDNDSAGESGFYNPDGNRAWLNFTIKINADLEQFPYVDTFQYFNSEELTLCNMPENMPDKRLDCTGGSFTSLEGVTCYNRSGQYDEDDCRWSRYHDEWLHYEDAIYIDECDDYFYESDGETAEAIKIGRRYILLEDCEEVECINCDDFSGLLEVEDADTITCYKLPSGDLLPTDEADIYDVFVIDGDIKGRAE